MRKIEWIEGIGKNGHAAIRIERPTGPRMHFVRFGSPSIFRFWRVIRGMKQEAVPPTSKFGRAGFIVRFD